MKRATLRIILSSHKGEKSLEEGMMTGPQRAPMGSEVRHQFTTRTQVLSEKQDGSGRQHGLVEICTPVWVWILTTPHPSCVPLDKSLLLSDLPCIYHEFSAFCVLL